MLGQDDLDEVEDAALSLYRMKGFDPDEPPSMKELCRACIDSDPERVGVVGESDITPINGRWRMRVHRMILPERAAWLIGHELGEWWYRTRGHAFCHAELEARCDAFGAALVTPREAFARAVKRIGHRVHSLARRFRTTQAVALLRIGEVAGRPVVYEGTKQRVARGVPFVWPANLDAVPRGEAHPIRVDGRWGMMAA